MNLINHGTFVLHSGDHSHFKIDADALTDEDIEAAACWIAAACKPFGYVEGVPMGGLRLAAALAPYCDRASETLLIVDDVWTTGASMNAQRAERLNTKGAVIFARSRPPLGVYPMFCMGPDPLPLGPATRDRADVCPFCLHVHMKPHETVPGGWLCDVPNCLCAGPRHDAHESK